MPALRIAHITPATYVSQWPSFRGGSDSRAASVVSRVSPNAGACARSTPSPRLANAAATPLSSASGRTKPSL